MALSEKCPATRDGKHDITTIESKGERSYAACKHCMQRP